MWVLLHGFTGSPSSWDQVVERMSPCEPPLRPTLTGHGAHWRTMQRSSFEDEIHGLAAQICAMSPAPRLIAGYSMGARVVVGLIATEPELFDAAVLIGVHPGLAGPAARVQRRAMDRARAQLLRTEGLESFVTSWEREPLFQTQLRLPRELLDRQRALRLHHDADGLAYALEVLGLGQMPDYGPTLAKLRIPVTVMAGALDTKFSDIAQSLARRNACVREVIVDGAGHNLLLEAPGAVAAALTHVEAEMDR
jgi:2-succinyl-6-hydroxy-2,4-cyclohexadiene-1-carboxylate synthase